MNPYFSLSDTIFKITETYPRLVDFLAERGFESLRDEAMRSAMGRSISLEAALRAKGMDAARTEAEMADFLRSQEKSGEGPVRMAGVLPCPIRLQLLERLEGWIKERGLWVEYELEAASMGLDWLKEQVEAGEEALADIYLSAGFSLFFDREAMGGYMERGVFQDMTGFGRLNQAFDNEGIDLKDPLGRYTIIGVVPAVFMVNQELLGERPCPESWEDLMEPEFAGSVAMPMRDLDLFHAVLLAIYARYGEAGVRKLGRSLKASMHPAQMIREADRAKEGPAVTVMPYFFTWMAGKDSALKPVWPKDGAVISPIFLLTKAAARTKAGALVDFLCSEQMGQVLSADGKFPATSPLVDNGLGPEQTFLWPGWEFIHSHDIGALLKETEQMFLEGMGGKE